MTDSAQSLNALEQQNEEVRQKDDCELCGGEVPDEDFGAKFMQAGGVLHGPFCSRDCYYGELMA